MRLRIYNNSFDIDVKQVKDEPVRQRKRPAEGIIEVIIILLGLGTTDSVQNIISWVHFFASYCGTYWVRIWFKNNEACMVDEISIQKWFHLLEG